MQSSELDLIKEALKKAERFLSRDFYELEQLQSSRKDTANFCRKTCQKAQSVLQEELSKFFDRIIFLWPGEEIGEIKDKTVIVKLVDSLANFSRSIPFFGIMVSLIRNNNERIYAEKAIIDFPALGEVVSAERNRGVFMERYRGNMAGNFKLRISAIDELSKSFIACSHEDDLAHISQSSNARIYGSPLYALAQFLSGKVDILTVESETELDYALKLFVEEAGGISKIVGNHFIASNLPLFEKIVFKNQ